MELSRPTLEALNTYDISSTIGGDKLSTVLEQTRSKNNINLYQKLERLRQEYSKLNDKLAEMEESISYASKFDFIFNP